VRWKRQLLKQRKRELTESSALALLSEFVEHTTGEAVRNYTVSGWLREWLTSKRDGNLAIHFHQIRVNN
jgi:hypothetical protein